MAAQQDTRLWGSGAEPLGMATRVVRPSGGLAAQPVPTPEMEQLPPVSRAFLENLIRLSLLTRGAADRFLVNLADRLPDLTGADEFGRALVKAGLLTGYQVDRILAGAADGLVLGSYRVLDRLGAGAMGIVFLGEHILMERKVAIKVLPVDDDCPAGHLDRFYNEMRALAKLHHPNIVMAYDSGRVAPGPGLANLLYLVMELVEGCNLEQYVQRRGPVPVGKACRWIRQAAGGLQEAHDHGLVHRDVKPSNLLLTRDEQVKLVDFGLVHQFSVALTDPKAVLGTPSFMSPEQSSDPSSVGTHADIYSLGATLFWLLTSEPPYPPASSFKKALIQLQQDPPRRLNALRPDVPSALDAILLRMLDRDPLRRPPMALSVMKYLEPFADR